MISSEVTFTDNYHHKIDFFKKNCYYFGSFANEIICFPWKRRQKQMKISRKQHKHLLFYVLLLLCCVYAFFSVYPVVFFHSALNVSYQLSAKLRIYKNGKPTFRFPLYIASVWLAVHSFIVASAGAGSTVFFFFFSFIHSLIHLISFPWFFLRCCCSFGCFHFSFVFAFCTPMTNKNLEGGANLYKHACSRLKSVCVPLSWVELSCTVTLYQITLWSSNIFFQKIWMFYPIYSTFCL